VGVGVQPETAASTVLRGRQAELARVMRLLDGLCAGGSGWLLIEGAAGAGKSALLRAFCAEAKTRGVSLAAVEADEVDKLTPVGTLKRAMDALSGPAVDIHRPDIDPLRPVCRAAVGVLAAIEEIRSVVEKAAASGPLAIVIDDAALADEATLQAVRVLERALSAGPVAWLLASRPDPKPAYQRVRAHRDAAGGRPLRLAPLAPAPCAEIAGDILGAAPDDDVGALVRTANGNLTVLVDLLLDGLQSDALVIASGTARLSARAGARLFEDALAPRLGRLSPQARRAIDVAAVLGRSFRLVDLMALLDAPAPPLAAESRQLIAEGLLVDDGGELAFPHELVRRVVLDALPAVVHRAVNRDIALHLVEGGWSAAAVGPFVVSGSAPTDPVPRPLVEALDQLGSALAIDAHVRALEFAVTGSRRWMSLVVPTARMLAYGGRLPDADALLRVALEREPLVADEAAIRVACVEAAWLRGRDADQRQALERVVRDPDLPANLTVPVRAALGAMWVGGAEPADDLAAADEAASASRSLRDHDTLSAALLAGSRALGRLGRMAEALTYATESASVTRRAPGATTIEPRIWLARALIAVDRLDDAQGYCEDVLCDINDRGNVGMLPAAHAVRARVLLARGKIVDAATEAEAGLGAAEATGCSQASGELLAIVAFLAAVTGDPGAARRAADRCADLVRSGIVDDGHLPLARAAAHAGDPAAVLGPCSGLIDALGSKLGPLVLDPGTGPLLARVALAGRDHHRARAVIGAVRRLAVLNPDVLGWSAAQLHAEGLVTADPAAMRDAAGRFTAVGRHLAAAMALADAAIVSVECGGPDGRAWLDEATAALTAMRAEAVVVDLRRRSAAAARPGRRPTRTVSGWDSLTGAELRVVTLAATGVSNKEIARQLWLSPHTVGTHVRHALDKLGLRSRVEMARQAGERGIAPGIRRPDRVLAHAAVAHR
jgi:DNA-binding CsgD family transcriptional regulator